MNDDGPTNKFSTAENYVHGSEFRVRTFENVSHSIVEKNIKNGKKLYLLLNMWKSLVRIKRA